MALHWPPRRHINQLHAKIGEIGTNSRSIAAHSVESTDWRGGVRSVVVAVSRRLSQYRCLAPRHRSVSSRRSSNRTCGSPASGSRTRSCLRPRKARRSHRKTSQAPFIPQPPVREAHISPLVPCACDTATDAAAGSHNPAAEAPVPQATAARLARADSPELPSLSHVAPPGVSEPVPGRLGSHHPHLPSSLPAPLSNQGPFPPPALPGFPGTTGLSATPYGPACPSRGSGWRVPRHRRGFPCCVHPPLPCVPPPLPRRNRPVLVSLASRPMPAFPVLPAGRLPHYPFSRPARRSLALRPAGSLSRLRDPSHRSASVHVVASIDRSDCYRLERQLPGGIRTR